MRPEDKVRIAHMVEAADDAAGFIAGKGRIDLDSNRMLLYALIRCIEIIGEAARQVSDETRSRCRTRMENRGRGTAGPYFPPAAASHREITV